MPRLYPLASEDRRLAGGSYYVNDAQILVTEVFASNGVVHVIDKVLLP